MNTTPTTWLAAAIVTLLVGAAYQLDGPDDIQAAADSAASTQDALQHARNVAACRQRLGTDAQMYLLDGQHLVCRARSTAPTTLTAKATP